MTDKLIFFYDARDGSAAIGKTSGSFVQTARFAAGQLSPGWSHVCSAARLMLLYNTATGALAWRELTETALERGGDTALSPGWTHVIGLASLLFVYNAITGAAASARIDPWSGVGPASYYPLGHFSPGWTHIAPLANDNALFYSAASGAAAIIGIYGNGPTIFSFPAGSFSTDWTHILYLEDRPRGYDGLFFYRATTGEAAIGEATGYRSGSGAPEVATADAFRTVQVFDQGQLSAGWTNITSTDSLNPQTDRDVIFFRREAGSAALVSLSPGFHTLGTYRAGAFSPGWTHVVRHSGSMDVSSGLMLQWGQMQGFCWPSSAAPGHDIDFRLSTAASTYTVSFVRFRNRHSATPADIDNSRELAEVALSAPGDQPGVLQNTQAEPTAGAASWETSFTLTMPRHMRSGVYAAKCQDALGSVFYVPFIVKPSPADRRHLAILANTNTWNAYNPWGGFSRYDVAADTVLSFLRPNFLLLNLSYRTCHWDQLAAGQGNNGGATYHYNSKHLLRAELWVLNWLAENGYEVDVYSDLDLHAGNVLDGYAAVILSTHPEYWSVPMYDHLKAYLDGGGRLIYLGGNGIYDSVDLSRETGMMVFGNQADRWTGAGTTRTFRKIGKPEGALLGVQFLNNVADRKPYVVRNDDPLLDGTLHGSRPIDLSPRLSPGDLVGVEGWCVPFAAASLAEGGASGFEVDGVASAPLDLIATGTNASDEAAMVRYRYGGNGFVFSVGSMSFGGSLVVDGNLQQIVRNALDGCLEAARAKWILSTPADTKRGLR